MQNLVSSHPRLGPLVLVQIDAVDIRQRKDLSFLVDIALEAIWDLATERPQLAAAKRRRLKEHFRLWEEIPATRAEANRKRSARYRAQLDEWARLAEQGPTTTDQPSAPRPRRPNRA